MAPMESCATPVGGYAHPSAQPLSWPDPRPQAAQFRLCAVFSLALETTCLESAGRGGRSRSLLHRQPLRGQFRGEELV